jgi:hypothetical protein
MNTQKAFGLSDKVVIRKTEYEETTSTIWQRADPRILKPMTPNSPFASSMDAD